MPLKTSKYIWHEGKLVPWEQATVHVLSHALHYGSSVFEGIRVYKTPTGAAGFRLTDHVRRLYHSAKIYRIKIPFALDVLVTACRDVVRENGLLNGAYIRPIAFRGYGEMGVAGNIDQPAACRSLRGNGARISAKARSSKASTSACRHGNASRRTRCLPSRRPAATICRARS